MYQGINIMIVKECNVGGERELHAFSERCDSGECEHSWLVWNVRSVMTFEKNRKCWVGTLE